MKPAEKFQQEHMKPMNDMNGTENVSSLGSLLVLHPLHVFLSNSEEQK
jgi:hypothetical protein